jgi:peroxiredoxin
MSTKLQAGAEVPTFTLPVVGGGVATIGGVGRWQMVVVYRGKHCPICRRYLGGLEALKDRLAELDTELLAVSADPAEKATAQVAETGLTVPVAYGLGLDEMRALGLYISTPRGPTETDRPFPEPAVFVINPEGRAQIIDISNAPFARPDLGELVHGISIIQERNYPIRGTAD